MAMWLSLISDGVVEAEAVVRTAAATDGIFLQRPKPRRRLARAGDPGAGALDGFDEGGRGGGNARQMAEEIERDAFGGKNRARIPVDAARALPAATAVAVLGGGREGDRRIDHAEGCSGERQTGDDAGLACGDRRLGAGVGGMVAAEVMSPARPRSSASARRTGGVPAFGGRVDASSVSACSAVWRKAGRRCAVGDRPRRRRA